MRVTNRIRGTLLATTLALFSIVGFTACGSEVAELGGALRSDSSGVAILVNTGEDWLLDWRFELLWSAGGIGDDELMLSILGPHQVDADGAGRVYVLDAFANLVLVLSADGAVIDTLGRKGAGPGELMRPVALTVEENGSIAVFDRGRGGLVRWSVNGVPQDVIRQHVTFWGPKLKVTPDDGALFTAYGGPELRLVLSKSGADRVLASVVPGPGRVADFPSCGAGQITVYPLFAPALVWDAEGGSVAINASAGYVIDIYEGEHLVRSIRRDILPHLVDQDIALKEAETWSINRCTPPPAEVVRGTGYAELLPTVKAIALSPQGELWVEHRGLADEPSRIDVFRNDGAYLGTLPTGSPFPSAFLPKGKILAVEEDSMEVPRISVYSMSRH